MSDSSTRTLDASGGSDAGTDRRRLVAVVDDESMVLAAMERLLTVWGFEVVPFGTFEDARKYLDEGNRPDALIVDIRLGEYNGLQLLYLAKQLHPDLRVIVVSGFDDPVLRADADRIGAAFVLKPFDSQELRERLG
jgi:two-component system response regulator YesN